MKSQPKMSGSALHNQRKNQLGLWPGKSPLGKKPSADPDSRGRLPMATVGKKELQKMGRKGKRVNVQLWGDKVAVQVESVCHCLGGQESIVAKYLTTHQVLVLIKDEKQAKMK